MIVQLRKGQKYSKILKTITNCKKKYRWRVMIVQLTKGQKYSKILKTITIKIQDIKIFKTISFSQETIQYPYFKL